MWPFGKKNHDEPAGVNEPEIAVEEAEPVVEQPVHDAVSGDTGPFDGDTVNIDDFDFSDFSIGVLNLGSMIIPLPKNSQVQVEMGEGGPRMVHVVTEFGRLTPVAFAAPSSAGQWAESVEQISAGMTGDGLNVETEQGPWGTEIVGTGANGSIRVIGVEGPRWMLRMTTTAPPERVEKLRDLAREMTARTFVYRGSDPILAGNSLPVTLPGPLVEQVQQAMQQRSQQANPNQ
ncbi:DUF3710 domain-containing protein [Corynebacterium atrinae]|uniref:DUF3710 domain-containing protein n=1 Tax=Corynebacterium atrinae TaxID=1336740 RepID=UPI003F49290E